MAIFCQINLWKPANATFEPGDDVSGIIKYSLREPMEFERIITSIKGYGDLTIRLSPQNSTRRDDNIYSSRETYVDIDHVVVSEKTKISMGCHEIKFNFTLPKILPSSFLFQNIVNRYRIYCRVKYYVRIKFERPGWFAFTKHYRKEIQVLAGIIPNLVMGPIIYGKTKKLLRFFSRKNAIVSIKATIQNSVIPIGGIIRVDYEIKNDTNVVISCFETQLIEIYTFKVRGQSKVQNCDEVPNTGTKIGRIECGLCKPLTLEISVPTNRVTLQHSKLVQRNYVVRTKVKLPMPHRNMLLDIPIEIGVINTGGSTNTATALLVSQPTAPPAYWETMTDAPNTYLWE